MKLEDVGSYGCKAINGYGENATSVSIVYIRSLVPFTNFTTIASSNVDEIVERISSAVLNALLEKFSETGRS